MEISAIGIPWFRNAEQFIACIAIFTDRDKLPDTYAEWLQLAEALVERLRRDGVHVVKAEMNPETFKQWCSANNMHLDASGRMGFANWKAALAIGGH
jgi:hypothetical protein